MIGLGRIKYASQQLWKNSVPSRKYLWQRWHNLSGESTPVFLVGLGRSGTNMLVRHLAKSWQIDLYNEDHPAAFDNFRIRDLPTIKKLVDRSKAKGVLFKPILDTHLARRYLEFFPRAKVLFAIRHYSDVINSGQKKFGETHWADRIDSWLKTDFAEFAPVPLPEETKAYIREQWRQTPTTPESGAGLYWLLRNRLFFDLELHQHERARLVQYEKIVSNPPQELAEICQFLSIRFEGQMLEDIYSSSIGRDTPPTLDRQILAECEALWLRLCQHVTDVNHN